MQDLFSSSGMKKERFHDWREQKVKYDNLHAT
jgi:hypothetical protein